MHYIVTNLSIFVSNNLIVMLLHLQQQTYNAAEDAHYKFTYQHRLFKKPMLLMPVYIDFFKKPMLLVSININFLKKPMSICKFVTFCFQNSYHIILAI